MSYACRPAAMTGVAASALSALLLVAQPTAANASGPTDTSATPSPHHYPRSGGHSSGDAITSDLNHQELVRVSSASTGVSETITNVTRYNYGHQTLPSGVSPVPPDD